MENTTTKASDIIEVITELTVSDVQLLKQVIDTCLEINLFAEEHKSDLQSVTSKLEKLSQDLQAAE